MIRSEFVGYRDVVLITADEDGIEAFTEIVRALATSGLRYVEVETYGDGPTLRLAFESRADREKREREAAEKKAQQSTSGGSDGV